MEVNTDCRAEKREPLLRLRPFQEQSTTAASNGRLKISFSKTGGVSQHPHETNTPRFNRMKYTNTGTKLNGGQQAGKSKSGQNKHIYRIKNNPRKG